MSQYVFRCQACDGEFALSMHIDEHDTATVRCPECGSENVRQEVLAFSAVTSKKS